MTASAFSRRRPRNAFVLSWPSVSSRHQTARVARNKAVRPVSSTWRRRPVASSPAAWRAHWHNLERLTTLGPVVGGGGLAFDGGAHLGARTRGFRKLGGRLVALAPQPAVRRWLVLLVGRSRDVSVRAEAVGRAVGTARLALSHRTPTMSSLAEDWPNALAERNPVFGGVRWDDSITVPVTTLDALIEQYGLPRFCKIDVEGYEAEVLAGLSHRIPALSVEFVVGALDVAEACVRRLAALGAYEVNVVEGGEWNFVSKRRPPD